MKSGTLTWKSDKAPLIGITGALKIRWTNKASFEKWSHRFANKVVFFVCMRFPVDVTDPRSVILLSARVNKDIWREGRTKTGKRKTTQGPVT